MHFVISMKIPIKKIIGKSLNLNILKNNLFFFIGIKIPLKKTKLRKNNR